MSEVEQAPAKFTVLAEVDGKMVQVAESPDVLSRIRTSSLTSLC